MGYYTSYKLKVSNEPDGLADRLSEIAQYGENFYRQLINGGPEPVKWYEHHENMIEISKLYPDVIFTLSGEGEESGDIWVKYYQNGKCQKELAKFDECEL